MTISTEPSLTRLLQARAATDQAPFAIFSDRGAITAADHWNLAVTIAADLARRGVGRGSRVILLGVTGPELLAALAACWRLGSLVCPAEAFLPADALQKVIAQFRPDLAAVDLGVEAGRVLAGICGSRGVPVVSLAEATQSTDRYEGAFPSPDGPALCIFTSGSTGMPKGVVLSQHNLVTGAGNIAAAKRISPQDRVLCVLPMSHLNGLETTFVTPLVTGGSVVYLQGSFQPERALKLIDEHRCTWFSAVPTQYAYLLKPPVPRDRFTLKTLRFCRSASAPLPVRVRQEFEAYYGVPIIETMGMTETSGQIFCNPMPPERAREGSVGRPFGFEVRAIGENGEPVAAGEIGEIQVRGPAVMLGYLDNPEETARAFEGEWLRSGDLGSVDPDGFWYIRGRIKDIAIFSGINISLRAIEASVQEAGLVEDIACIGTPDYFFGETVVAYVIAPQGGRDLPAVCAEVAAKLREQLPSQQALKEVRVVKRFPRSSAGKVLKGRLGEEPVLHTTRQELSHDPRQLLSSVLHLPEHGIHEGLGLGLIRQWDSLGHVALVLAVESLLGRPLAVAEIVALTTFKGLAKVLDGTLGPDDVDQEALADEAGIVDENTLRQKSQLIALMKWNRLLPEGDATAPGAGEAVRGRFGHAAGGKVLTFAAVVDALKRAGLAEGDTALVHSDVAALGLTEVGHDRDAALDFYYRAFREVIGDQGTLSMCTSFEDYGRYGTPFVLEESPSRLGALSEYFRTLPGAVRSLHPIVSVTSIGPRAQHVSGEPHFEGFGYDSPWGRLHRLNAKLITIGMGNYPEMGLTFLHYIEHAYGVPYQYVKLYTAPVLAAGRRIPGPFTMSVRYLDYGITYDTNRFKNDLVAAGSANIVELGANSIFLTTAQQAMDLGVQKLRGDRYYFLKDPPRFRPGEIPADGATGDLQYVYDRAVASE